MHAAHDAQSFRRMMGRFTTGVAVILAAGTDGPVGATVNSLTSLSLDPPLLLFCASNESRTGANTIENGLFSVNLLTAAQRDISNYFAGAGAGWDASRCRRHAEWVAIPDCNGSLFCEVVNVFPGGDHRIIVGRVRHIMAPEPAERPLVFHEGRYGRLEADCLGA